MDMNELRNDSGSDDENNSAVEQKKSLIANVYSNRGIQDPDGYKELDDWDVDDDDLRLAYEVTSGGGLVRRNLKKIASSGSHEEWYTELQVALAHRIAQLTGSQMPDGRDVRGAVPVMEQISVTGEDVMDFLREHPEAIEQLDTEELAELREEQDDEAEPAPADD